MSRFWKVVVVFVLVLGAMLLITYLNPGVKTYALDLATRTHLPLWLVGLAAPILFVLQKLGNLLGGLLGDSQTEKDIREKNEAIKARLGEVERSVGELDAWRKSEIDRSTHRIEGLEQNMAGMKGRARTLDETIDGLLARKEQLENSIQEDPGTVTG